MILLIVLQSIQAALAPAISMITILGLFVKRINGHGAFVGMLLGIVVGAVRLVLNILWAEECKTDNTSPICWDFNHFAVLQSAAVALAAFVGSSFGGTPEEQKLGRSMIWDEEGSGPEHEWESAGLLYDTEQNPMSVDDEKHASTANVSPHSAAEASGDPSASGKGAGDDSLRRRSASDTDADSVSHGLAREAGLPGWKKVPNDFGASHSKYIAPDGETFDHLEEALAHHRKAIDKGSNVGNLIDSDKAQAGSSPQLLPPKDTSCSSEPMRQLQLVLTAAIVMGQLAVLTAFATKLYGTGSSN